MVCPDGAKRGSWIGWLICLAAVLAGWWLVGSITPEKAILARGHQTVDVDPDSCSIEERDPARENIDSSRGLGPYGQFYVCSKSIFVGGAGITTNYCIPFIGGVSDYTAYGSDYGPPVITDIYIGIVFRQRVPHYGRLFYTPSSRAVDCSVPDRTTALNIVCNFNPSSDPPHDEGPFRASSLSDCQLRFTSANPDPITTLTQINWGSRRPSSLGPGDAYLVLARLAGCRSLQPIGQGQLQACRLPPISSSSNSYTNFDICWQVSQLDRPVRNPDDGDSLGGYPWDGGLGLGDLAESAVGDVNCQTLAPARDSTPSIIRYYRFSSLILSCTVDPSGSNGLDPDRLENDCYLVGSARVPADADPPSGSPGGPGFSAHICTGSACGFLETVDNFLRWLSYLVVPLIIIMIIYGGISLSLAGDNPEATRKAKARITQAIVALVCFGLLWGFLKWLIP